MNVKISVFLICVKGIIHFLLYDSHTVALKKVRQIFNVF